MKLFEPVSIVNDFKGYNNVLLRWLIAYRPIPLPYHLIIENYIPSPPEGEDDIHFFVDELFTEDELKQFTDYILKSSGTIVYPKIISLPIKNQPHLRYTSCPLGGEVNCLMIYERPNYTLPFKVEAFYDLWDGHCIQRP